MYKVQLDAFDLLAVEGQDARKFLQGQVSCDVNSLSGTRSVQGAICNLKGRVISDFRLLEIDDICYLQLEHGMAGLVKQVLDRYIVFSKARCEVRSGQFQRLGLFGPDVDALLSAAVSALPGLAGDILPLESSLVLRTNGIEPRYEVWHPRDHGPLHASLATVIEQQAEPAPIQTWLIEEFKAGMAHIKPGMEEVHLPEALNYDVNGLINFKKGCYTGQEIVARMFYRAVAKRRLYYLLGTGLSEVPHSIACRLEESPHVDAGELVGFVNDQQGRGHILAVLPAALYSQPGKVFVNGDESSHVLIQPLPYAIK